jgi:hypothetical protein
MQGMDASLLKTIRSEKDPEKQARLFREQGIAIPKGKTANDLIDQTLDTKAMAIIEMGGKGLATGVNSGKLLNQIKSGNLDLQSAEGQAFAQAAALSGFKGGAPEAMRQVRAIYAETPANTDKANMAMKGEGGSAILKTMDDLRTSGFKQLSEQALQATVALGGTAKALETLVELNKGLEDFGAKGGEAKFATAATDAAESFGKSTLLFDNTITNKFIPAINKMMQRAGLNSDVPGQQDIINDLKKKGSGIGN